MSTRDRLRRTTTAALGDSPEHAFTCQNITGTVIGALYLPGLIAVVLFASGVSLPTFFPLLLVVLAFIVQMSVLRVRVVAVTRDEITVFSSSSLVLARFREIGTLPRSTALGPVTDQRTFWGRIRLMDGRWFVHKRYWEDIDEADAAAGAVGPAGDG